MRIENWELGIGLGGAEEEKKECGEGCGEHILDVDVAAPDPPERRDQQHEDEPARAHITKEREDTKIENKGGDDRNKVELRIEN